MPTYSPPRFSFIAGCGGLAGTGRALLLTQAEWVCPRFLLHGGDEPASEGGSPRAGVGRADAAPGLLGLGSECLLGKGPSVPISCPGS